MKSTFQKPISLLPTHAYDPAFQEQRSGRFIEMAAKAPAAIAGQRFGLALSYSLLGLLRPLPGPAFRGNRVEQAAELYLEARPSAALIRAHPRGGASAPEQGDPDRMGQGHGEVVDVPIAALSRYSQFGSRLETNPILGITEIGARTPMTTEDDGKRDSAPGDWLGLPEELRDPVKRRAWLLAQALQAQPLDRALELARSAEGFITGAGEDQTPAKPVAADGRQLTSERLQTSPAEKAPKPRPVSLAPEARERLLDRLAKGARNAELASDFGLTPKQVQGIRMGSAREIDRRRERASVSPG